MRKVGYTNDAKKKFNLSTDVSGSKGRSRQKNSPPQKITNTNKHHIRTLETYRSASFAAAQLCRPVGLALPAHFINCGNLPSYP